MFQETWGLLTLTELSFKKRESNSLPRKISASLDSGLSRSKMSIGERSSNFKSNTLMLEIKLPSLIVTMRHSGKEKSAKSPRKSSKTLATDPRESLATPLVTLLLQSRKSWSECLTLLRANLLTSKDMRISKFLKPNPCLQARVDQDQTLRRIFCSWTILRTVNLRCLSCSKKLQLVVSLSLSLCNIKCRYSMMMTPNQSRTQWKMRLSNSSRESVISSLKKTKFSMGCSHWASQCTRATSNGFSKTTLATSHTSTSSLLEILRRKQDKNRLPETKKRRTAKDSASDSLRKTSLRKM